MRFELTILGSNSALPAHDRYPTSQLLSHHNRLYLIDCGEGTQIRLSKLKIRRTRINQIFISHLHGDHVFGLPGLITSYAQLGREEPLEIFGPVGIKELLETTLRLSGSRLEFQLIIKELALDNKSPITESDDMRISAFPLQHRLPTYGFIFEEKILEKRIRKEVIDQYNLTIEQIKEVKLGKSLHLGNGTVVANEDLTERPARPRKYVYCSDTTYMESIIPFIRNADLLYHEATFLHNLLSKAIYSKHSTALQAGQLARKAEVVSLLIGHYSSRYKDLTPLLEEAQSEFPATQLAIEGETYLI